ncbi:POGO family transposable element, partial [Ixodes scapularis]
WRKDANKPRSMKSSKKANRDKKAHWPQLEDRPRTWILEQRAAGRGLSTVQARLKAQTLAKDMNVADFVGAPFWCFHFMRRHQLAIRAHTTVCQKLPDDFKGKMASFQEQIQAHDVRLNRIVNMDEVPLTFDIPMGRTQAEKGEKMVSQSGNKARQMATLCKCKCITGSRYLPAFALIMALAQLPHVERQPMGRVTRRSQGEAKVCSLQDWIKHTFT